MIYLASDHAGFELKNQLADFLKKINFEFVDLGPFSYDKLDDYPDFIIPAARKVGEDPRENKAIILGWSGQGEAMAANKVKGVRAVVYYGGQPEIIKLSRIHNNANVLSLGAGFLSAEEAIEVVKIWLETGFLNEARHRRRLEKISRFEASVG